MRELSGAEISEVSGGLDGYQAAGAIMSVLTAGAMIATAPISAPVLGIAFGAAGGLAVAQYLADL